MLKRTAQLLSLFFITGLLFACGGSSESTTDPLPKPVAEKGSLSLDISGLPASSQASISLTGPDGFSQTLTSTTKLENLTPGTYQLRAEEVDADGLIYSVLPATQTVNVVESQTTSESMMYMTDVRSVGVISNFGSVYVNGVRYGTDDVKVETDENENASEDDLDIGMVVTLRGRSTADNSVNEASSIEYRVNAEGPVSMVSLSQQQVSIFNQVFNVDDSTIYINTSLEQLFTNDIVEISAILDANGQWLATRIELEDSGAEFRLRGPISNIDGINQTFSILDTIVDYSSATIEGTLVDGASARISSNQGLVENQLIASVIRVEVDDQDDDNAGQISRDGIIESVDGSSFLLQGQTVLWNDSTEFKGGSPSDLAANLRVKVHGVLSDTNNENVLLARQIRVDKNGIIKVEGAVEFIDLENNQIQLSGLLFSLDMYSQLKDDSSDNIRRFSLELLAVGDWVEIKAFANGDNLIVKKLEREAKDTEVEDDERFSTKLEGQVSEINQPNLQLRGSNVVTTSLTKFEISERTVDLQSFFDTLSVGDWIEVKGTLQNDGSVAAVKVETGSQGEGSEDNGGVEFTGIIDEFISINEFRVNGRSITTNERTTFTNGLAAELAIMQVVEIHGREADDGSILATRVHFEDNDDDNDVELKGLLTNDALDGLFNIDTQQISFNDSTVFEDGSAANLVAGTLVEVKGRLDQNGVLIAARIEIEDDMADESEVIGEISEIINESSFVVGNQFIVLQPSTEFEFGNSSRLAVGIWVKVEGYFDDQQQLIAREVKFTEAERVEIEGVISSIISDNQFSIGELVVEHDRFTEFEDGSAADLDIDVEVSVKGVINDQGILEAVEVEFED